MSNKSSSPAPRSVGDYELLETIGRGGMSVVYRGRDLRTDAIVAIKIASKAVRDDPQLRRRFDQEFAVIKPLSHPHLVRVLDKGSHQGGAFLVMEYVDGPSLAQHLRTKIRLTEPETLAILRPVGEALTYLHTQNIIHRDVKPGNILMSTKGDIKLGDMGLAKDLGSLSRLTRSNVALGTLQFMAPEQFDDAASADPRSDVYALAATAYQALMGEQPFGKGTVLAISQRKLRDDLAAPSDKAPMLRPALNAALRQALHADPKKRPRSVAEFMALLTEEASPSPTPDKTIDPGTSAAKSPGDNRAEPRFEVVLPAIARVSVGGGQRWPSTITDLSTTGLCVQMQRRFESGALLAFTFSLESDEGNQLHLARVRWIKPTRDGGWLLGCQFVSPLGNDALDAIFFELASQTKAGKK